MGDAGVGLKGLGEGDEQLAGALVLRLLSGLGEVAGDHEEVGGNARGDTLADVGGVAVADGALASGIAKAGCEWVPASDLDALRRFWADVDIGDMVDP